MFPAHHAHGHGTAGLQLRHCTAADAERRVVSWLALDVLHILSTSSTRGPLHAVCPRGESRGDLRRASGSHVSVFAAVLEVFPTPCTEPVRARVTRRSTHEQII